MPSESGSSGPTMVRPGLLGFGEADHGVEVFEIDGDAARDLSHAAIAGRANDFGDSRAALHGPGQSMLAASGTKDENFHGANLSLRLFRSRKNMVGNGGRGSQTRTREHCVQIDWSAFVIAVAVTTAIEACVVRWGFRIPLGLRRFSILLAPMR